MQEQQYCRLAKLPLVGLAETVSFIRATSLYIFSFACASQFSFVEATCQNENQQRAFIECKFTFTIIWNPKKHEQVFAKQLLQTFARPLQRDIKVISLKNYDERFDKSIIHPTPYNLHQKVHDFVAFAGDGTIWQTPGAMRMIR